MNLSKFWTISSTASVRFMLVIGRGLQELESSKWHHRRLCLCHRYRMPDEEPATHEVTDRMKNPSNQKSSIMLPFRSNRLPFTMANYAGKIWYKKMKARLLSLAPVTQNVNWLCLLRRIWLQFQITDSWMALAVQTVLVKRPIGCVKVKLLLLSDSLS